MKLNKLNKYYIVLAVILVIASIYRKTAYKGGERYNYSITITAPITFPIYVKEAYFLLPDGELEGANIESTNNFNSAWGIDYGSSNHASSARLPSQFFLKYFSYRDKKFYSHKFELPQNEILNIFKTADRNNQSLILSQFAGLKKGLSFVVGIANNGYVVVWLRGVFLEKELLRAKLKSVEPKASDLDDEKNLTRDEYFKQAFENLSDSLKMVYDKGFDDKANYVDTPSRYIELNTELWENQQKKGLIDFKK
ncbi:DUF2931 family protein [Pedobacter sp. N36a]|uniref:DUF2931 family protein n=1 Tax=Pedobacter sp. N36a TaxID=2767996 RepID=UPI001657070A|nr:DUF2931 family protein [Pedobacter sp. N36a]MBC8987004.1 DUF2931 family protein [Pedobacter sp. N36a]